ncbi:MAG: hypothetical protein K0Q72_2201 [Armatimonadetes bacterium]|jgi:hypothetical protein|nr:hypothetical protein [Armatimonadota bacterium]
MSTEHLLQIANDGLTEPDLLPGAHLSQELWNAAHGVHRSQGRAHVAGSHGFGIVRGLEVTATNPPSQFVTIQPGLAVDREGGLIAVGQTARDRPLRLCNVSAERTGWLHIVLTAEPEHRDAPDNQYVEVVRTAMPAVTWEAPGPHDIELARILFAETHQTVQDAVDPVRIKPGELDLRFRTSLGNSIRSEVVIGQIYPLQRGANSRWDHHRVGLALLARELQSTGQYQARTLPLVNLEEDQSHCHLLCLGGSGALSFAAEELTRLREFIQHGGILFAESCVAGFDGAARTLASNLGIALNQLSPPHPLLTAHHVFNAVPAGNAKGQLYIGAPAGSKGWMILSTCDYGCAWEGGKDLNREQIRTALEFGVNLAAFASHNRETARLVRERAPEVRA